ncbi:MAG: alkaline phosphatase family protein [Flavobacteriales bacterium]|nr:alkaline phosphatase family protein [Flavobacteriales bacterium]
MKLPIRPVILFLRSVDPVRLRWAMANDVGRRSSMFRPILLPLLFPVILFAQEKGRPIPVPVATVRVASAQPPAWTTPPKLVVGIIVDQMRTDYIYRYWDNFGDGGFKRLIGEGAFCRDAHFDHVPTETGPGHATVYTGAPPGRHGIVLNERYIKGSGRIAYCVEDPDVQGVGIAGSSGQRSPRELLVTTLSDELERRTDGASRTIGLSFKDRGAILPIGRTGDGAYWFGKGPQGPWVTSTWYMEQLPKWVVDFNAEGRAAKYLQNTWEPLLPRARYHTPLEDDNPFETPIPSASSATLPLDLRPLFQASGSTAVITYTPWANTLTTDFALAALVGEELGVDAVPDLLAISYSATDYLSHWMGPRALEVEDMYLRLDKELARLFADLDVRVGKGQYTVFLTADHAGPDLPGFVKEMKGNADYLDEGAMEERVNAALSANLGPGDWVDTLLFGQVYLNDSLIRARKADRALVQRLTVQALLSERVIADAVTAVDLATNQYHEGVRRSLQRGYIAQRNGDVLFAAQPGCFQPYADDPARGVSHGSPWNYDTHVPILFMGKGISHGEVLRRVSVEDVAPTVAMLVGMTMPNASTGQVVPEVIGIELGR